MTSHEYDYKDVTILTPYNGQLAAFIKRFSKKCSLWLSEKDREKLIDEGLLDVEGDYPQGKTDVQISSMLKLATIDNFQGEESKVVVLSLVRSNTDGLVGFLKNSNRINVGCSRARDGFYIVGNASQMRGVEMWNKIIHNLEGRGKIGSAFHTCCPRHPHEIFFVRSPEQWYQIPECQATCETGLPCGHICTMKCHAPALHERIGCAKQCPKIHSCGHPCLKTCNEDCGDCAYAFQNIRLPCGHKTTQSCSASRDPESVSCDVVLTSQQLPCGHSQEVRCSTRNKTPECTKRCGQILKCGHTCGANCQTCSTRAYHSLCISPCSKDLLCGHRCAAPCHGGQCPPCTLPCQESCQHGSCSQTCSSTCDPCIQSYKWACPHISACTTICCLPCARLPCSELCPEVLSCGHRCPSLCSERCPIHCLQCVMGQAPIKVQMFLACGHHFDLQTLDEHFGINKIFQINSAGHIVKVNLAPIKRRPSVNCSCPACGQDCKDLRRYALSNQLSNLESNIDRICAKIDHKLNAVMGLMCETKTELDKSFESFVKALRPGPLTGRTNQAIVIGRGNTMAEVQSKITDFRGMIRLTKIRYYLTDPLDNVVRPFEANIADLVSFLGAPTLANEIDINFPFHLHFDALFYRCRLIVLEEGLRMQGALKGLRGSSRHASIMAYKLREMTTSEAKEHLATLKIVIRMCEAKHLKRLETELRLVQICFHVILRDAEVRSELDVATSLCKIQDLCSSFPDSAGLLSITYVAIKGVLSGRQRCCKMYSEESVKVWWNWPNHVIGDLRYCKFGHPYSSKTWDTCPYCGNEVHEQEVVRPDSFLKEEDFIAAMHAMASSTSTKAWRA